MTVQSQEQHTTCITILRYAGAEFGICTVHNEVVPRRELSKHCAQCSGALDNHEQYMNLNDDTSPVMTLQRLFESEVVKWQQHHFKLPFLPNFAAPKPSQTTPPPPFTPPPTLQKDPNNTEEDRAICKLCLAQSNQVHYTRTSTDRLAHLQSFHPKIFATFDANMRDLTANFNNKVKTSQHLPSFNPTFLRNQLTQSLTNIETEIERDYFLKVHVVKLRDGSAAGRGIGDFVWFPSMLSPPMGITGLVR